MYVIKLKNKDLFLHRKPYLLVELERTVIYRSIIAAKSALKSSDGGYFGDLGREMSSDEFEIRKVKVKIV